MEIIQIAGATIALVAGMSLFVAMVTMFNRVNSRLNTMQAEWLVAGVFNPQAVVDPPGWPETPVQKG